MNRSSVAIGVLGFALLAGMASAQTQRTDFCVSGIADVYPFNPGSYTQNEIRLITTLNNPGFFLIVYDSYDDVVGEVYSNSRSLHFSTGMLSGRHEVAVGCVRGSDYTIQWVSGNERQLGAPSYVVYSSGSETSAKAGRSVTFADVGLERTLQRAHGKHAAQIDR